MTLDGGRTRYDVHGGLSLLVIRLRPRSTRTDTLFPYTTRLRSGADARRSARTALRAAGGRIRARSYHRPVWDRRCRRKIGRAHLCTPVTNAHLVCRRLLERKYAGHQLSARIPLAVRVKTTTNKYEHLNQLAQQRSSDHNTV